jgi:acyl-coenzyme A thioesterase PaaI-like protein
MDVTQLPFNTLVGLRACEPGSGFLVEMAGGPEHENHLGTVHAAALLAAAEAASGAFLAKELGDRAGFVPVVRRLEAKFRRPAKGRVAGRVTATAATARQWLAEAETRGRALASVPVEVADDAGVVVLTATVEWFLARAT